MFRRRDRDARRAAGSAGDCGGPAETSAVAGLGENEGWSAEAHGFSRPSVPTLGSRRESRGRGDSKRFGTMG